MARVVLLVPPLPQPLAAPYLGQQSVAAALLRAGHEVTVVDAAAVHFAGGEEAALAAVAAARPDVVGLTVFTYNAAAAWRLAPRLRAHVGLVVAGGPHVTAVPDEALARGCDAAVAGEGETLAVALAGALDSARHRVRGPLPAAVGLRRTAAFRDGPDPPGRAALADLGGLPLPTTARACYPPAWYAGGSVVPGGIVTSRGCPARCTFCANHVTGRVFRGRSPDDVVAELLVLHEEHGLPHVPFWDDAFTARAAHARAVCAAIRAEPRLARLTWSCATPARLVRPELLAELRAAGCVSVDFGLESGDPGVLRAIGKGQRPAQVLAAVQAARAAGIRTVVNFMAGFPGEGLAELATTQRVMEALAPHTDWFNPHGVLVPFPGTAIYEAWHERCGFTDWWLDEARIPRPAPLPPPGDVAALHEWLAHDPALDQDFFRYESAVRDAIAALVRFKAEHNRRRMERR
jgi:radical SAM superfamily enzyme YgiQ (UPF0313 family)